MPRAFDLRIPKADKDPLANLLDFSNIDQAAEKAGMLMRGYIESQIQGIINVIEDLTGLDLHQLADLLTSFDISDPEAFIASVINFLVTLPDVLLSLLDQLVQLLATAPEQAQNMLIELLPWLDIEAQLHGVLDGIDLEPGGVLRMIRKAISDSLEDIPLLGEITQPLTGLVGQIDVLETNFTNLRSAITAQLDELNQPIGEFDPTAMITRLIDDRIKPLEKLAELVEGLLPDSQKPQWLQDITDNIHNAYANLGDPLDINQGAPSSLDAIFGVFSTGLNASTQASMLASRIRALESAGNTFSIDFGGASSSGLGGDWVVNSSGGGSGSMGLDGKGNMVWKPSGAGSRIQIGRYTADALTIDNGIIETVLSSSPQSPIFDDAYTYMNFRMNTAGTTYTRLRIGYGTIRLQAVVSSAVTNIGPNASVSPKAGDRLRVAFGEAAAANPLHFVISLNGNTIPGLDFTDGGTAQHGASYLHIGAGMETGNRLVIGQNIPPGLGVLSVSEVI